MSSLEVRQQVRGQLEANWSTTPWFDLSDFVSASDVPNNIDEAYVLLQFMAPAENLVTIGPNDAYRESGVIHLHYVAPTGQSSMQHLPVMEDLRKLFRNKRFDRTVIENAAPFQDQEGAAIRIEGPHHGWTAQLTYYTDVNCDRD